MAPPKPGKQAGEECRVSTECAAGLRCTNDVCMAGACAEASECTGSPPAGCSAWACIAGVCEPQCPQPDGGAREDALPRDASPPDARAPDASPDSGVEPADGGVHDDATEPMDATPEDTGMVVPDTGVALPDTGAIDTGVPDTGAIDAGMSDSGPADSGICGMSSRRPHAGDLLVNEFFAAPSGTSDPNGDGNPSSTQDEFIELANTSTSPIDLGGVVVSDALQTRHVFAPATVSCGKVIVVFGGGNTAAAGWRSNWVVASTGGLALNNTGDTIRVGTSTGAPADLITQMYGSEANRNESLVRSPELRAGSPFVRHTMHPQSMGAAYSPGVRADGSEF